jgi:hypothetical protein
MQHPTAPLTRLRQLTELRVAQLNQQRLVGEPAVRHSFGELLALSAGRSRALEAQIAALIAASHKPASQKKVVRVGLAHKLLIRLNAKARDMRDNITCSA